MIMINQPITISPRHDTAVAGALLASLCDPNLPFEVNDLWEEDMFEDEYVSFVQISFTVSGGVIAIEAACHIDAHAERIDLYDPHILHGEGTWLTKDSLVSVTTKWALASPADERLALAIVAAHETRIKSAIRRMLMEG